MILQRLSKILLSAGLSLGLFASCANIGCEETRESYLLIHFKTQSAYKSISRLNAFALIEGKNDSIMTSMSTPNSLELILQPDAQETRVRLQLTISELGQTWQADDTLTIRYDSYPYFINMDCGCSIYFDIKSVESTNQELKDVTIKHAQISNEETVNLIVQY